MAREEGATSAIMTPSGTVCFPHVWEPHSFKEGQEKQFKLILVFDADTDISELKKACQQAALAKFGKADLQKLMKQNKFTWPWRDGDEYSEYGEPFVEGATFINFKSKNAPGIVDEWARPIENQMDFYAGCKARVSALPWPYDSMGNQGCTFLLNNIQKTDDGTKLAGGRMSAENEFEAVKKGTPPKSSGFSSTKDGGKPTGKGKASSFDDMDDDIPF